MINAKELRIGNYVNYIVFNKHESLFQNTVWCLNYSSATLGDRAVRHDVKYNNIEPIPLTEEWLLRFGFDAIGYECPETGSEFSFPYRIKISDNENIEVEDDFSVCVYYNDDDFIPIGNIRYDKVHQLQNLYFALTNTELTIK